MKLKKRESLGKKIAIGMSLINLANVVGPFGMLTTDISVPGGHVYADNNLHGTAVNLPGEMGGYVQTMLSPRVAYAASTSIAELPNSGGTAETVNDGDEKTIGTMSSGGKQYVDAGGTGIVVTMNSGGYQSVDKGGSGTVSTMIGGEQHGDGTMTVGTMNGGSQYVGVNGNGTVNEMSSGKQTVYGKGTIGIMHNNGEQNVMNGSGTVTTMHGGMQKLLNGAIGTVADMNGGVQYVSTRKSGTIENMDGGKQEVVSGTGTVNVMNDGQQNVSSGGTGTVSTMDGGEQTVNSGGNGTVSTMNGGSQTVDGGYDSESIKFIIGTGTIVNMNGGTQTVNGGTGIVEKMIGGTTDETFCLQEIKGGGATGSGIVKEMSGGTQTVYAGAIGTVETMSGGTQNVSGGPSVFDKATGTISTMIGGVQNVAEYCDGTVTIMKGGTQEVFEDGNGTIETMYNGGSQTVSSGGTGTVATMSGGEQTVSGLGYVTTMEGGMQYVSVHGIGRVLTMSGGGQTVYTGAYGRVSAMIGGVQGVSSGGDGLVSAMNGGKQTVYADGTGTVEKMNGGEQEIQDKGTGKIIDMSGGKQDVSAGGSGTVETMNGGNQTVEKDGTGTIGTMEGGQQNVYGSGTVSIMNSGKQMVYSGGSGTVTTMNDGEQQILSGSGTVGTMNGGTQVVYDNQVGTIGTLYSGGTQHVSEKGTSIVSSLQGGLIIEDKDANVTVTSATGGTWQLNSGVAKSGCEVVDGYTLIMQSGAEVYAVTVKENGKLVENGGTITNLNMGSGTTRQLGSGVAKTGETIDGYTLDVMSGAAANSGTVLSNGQITVNSGGQTSGTNVVSGTETIMFGGTSEAAVLSADGDGKQIINSGGTARRTVVNGGEQTINNGGVAEYTKLNGGKQVVSSGGKAMQTVVNGGEQIINNGGVAENTELNDGRQTVSGGGKAIKTTVNGGELFVSGGGAAEKTIMQGGTVSVDDNASVQIGEATAGYLRLLYTGDAMAKFGNSSISNHSYSVDRLFATGDKVVLGHGNGSGYSINNTLNVATMEGYADFVINTDLANNKSDKINITNTTGAAGANGVIVNYDPSAESAPGTDIPSSSLTGTIFATTDNAATFEGKESAIDIGGNTYEYTPEVTGTPNGSGIDWAITALRYGASSSSQLIKNGLGNRAYMLGRWRDSNADILKRLLEVRRGDETGIWASITRGSQKAHGDEFNVNGTYTTINVGFDRETGNGWTVGGAVSHSMGSEGYEKGSGESRMTSLNAYAMWQAKDNQFAEFTARVGQLKSDFFSTGNSGTAHADGITSWGQSLSAAYGKRFRQADGWVFEPKAEFTWAHLNGAGYMADTNTRAAADGANSAMASLGMHIGKFVGGNGYVYLDTKLVHDFAGGVGIDMYNGSRSNRLADDIRGTWLDTMIGYSCKAGACDLFVEGGLRAGGSGVSRDWNYRLGFNWAF